MTHPSASRASAGRTLRLLSVMPAVMLALTLPASAQGILDVWNTVKAPPPPSLSHVTMEPGKTALLVLDLATQTCNQESRPRCIASLPTVAKLIQKARAKKWTVIYTLGAASAPSDILPAVAMQGGEPVVKGPPDKFIGSNLESLLKERGIKTVVAAGAASEGAVLQTATSAAFRGFDVVVPVDAMSSATLYAEQYTTWDLVNAPRLSERVKLSAVDMIE